MELQFNKTICQCLRQVACQKQTQEQTQEIRLPDGMPDIGRVLGCWGQVLIRGKEWRTGGMNISGGVLAKVLYAPEDGSDPRSADCWIPFQMKWEFPETERDGTICVQPRLKSMDARSVSARKMMVRCVVSILGQAMESVDAEVFFPDQVPEDVQLLKQTYPMMLPREAGEKAFQLDEELTLPASCPSVRKIVYYDVMPVIQEQKVMAGRLVFRGNAMLHMLYTSDDSGIYSWDWEIPFSQYTDLDRDHGPNAEGKIIPIVTSAEMDDAGEGRMMLKTGLSCQYVIYDRVMQDVVEDAYSTGRKVELHTAQLNLPVLLDDRQETIAVSKTAQVTAQRVADVAWYPDQPSQMQRPDAVEFEIPGTFQILYYDDNGALQGTTLRSEETYTLPTAPDNKVDAMIHCDSRPEGNAGVDNVQVTASAVLNTSVFSEHGLQMVTGLELGELREPDPSRPSLILRKAGDSRLWDIAKDCGSTVEAIRSANKLKDDPEADRYLLVPVS